MRACARAHKTPCILYLVNFSMRACARAHKTPYILPYCKCFYARMRACARALQTQRKNIARINARARILKISRPAPRAPPKKKKQ